MKMTERQKMVLDFCADHIIENCNFPTYQEIGDKFEMWPNAAAEIMQCLIKYGYVELVPTNRAKRRLTAKGWEACVHEAAI